MFAPSVHKLGWTEIGPYKELFSSGRVPGELCPAVQKQVRMMLVLSVQD